MTLAELREFLASPQAWSVFDIKDCDCAACWAEDRAAYCEERARNLSQALVLEAQEKDAAVRRLISEAAISRGLLEAVAAGKFQFSQVAAEDVAARLGDVLQAVVKLYPPEAE